MNAHESYPSRIPASTRAGMLGAIGLIAAGQHGPERSQPGRTRRSTNPKPKEPQTPGDYSRLARAEAKRARKGRHFGWTP